MGRRLDMLAARQEAADARELHAIWRARPDIFCRDALGETVWPGGRSILDAIAVPHSRVTVQGAHSTEKSRTAARIVLWAVACGGKAIVTASRFEQVKRNIFLKVHEILEGARIPLGVAPTATEIKLRPDVYGVGWAASDEVKFQGEHGTFLVYLIDEADDVSAGIIRAIEGGRASGDVRDVMFANPMTPAGPFFDATSREEYRSIVLSAFDSPNLADVACAEAGIAGPGRVRELTEIPEEELDDGPAPYLAGPRFALEALRRYGPGSAVWRWKVLGVFPDEDLDSVILGRDVAAQRSRTPPALELGADPPGIYVGIDVAGPGEDEHAIAVFEKYPGDHMRCLEIDAENGQQLASRREDVGPQEALLDHTRGVLARLPRKPEAVHVDEIGIGAYLVPILRQDGYTVIGVNVARSCESDGDKRAYSNEKARLYWEFRERFRAGRISGIEDETTRAQLVVTRWDEPKGRIRIESKQDLVDRHVPSPDRAEAAMLACSRVAGDGVLVGSGGPVARPRTPSGRLARLQSMRKR